MNHRVILADAGPLIALSRIGELDLLRHLFGRVHLTRTVHDEVFPQSGRYPDTEALARAQAEGWLEVVDLPVHSWKPFNPGVDEGEASTIMMAESWRDQGCSCLVVIDDRAGRQEAKARRLNCIGTAGVIGLAKQKGHVAAAAPLLYRLVESDYFISHDVIRTVLTRIGE